MSAGRWDPDGFSVLESERDSLLRELEEVDNQLKNGEIDAQQHRALTERLTADAARAIVAIERKRPVPAPSRSMAVRLGTAASVLLGVVLIGWFLIGQLAPRQPFGVADTEVSSTEQRAARLAEVLEGDPSNVPARMAYARFLIQMDELPAAVEQFDEVIRWEPDNVEAMTYGGWVAVLAGADGGLERLDRAIQTEPRYPDAWALRGLARMRSGEEEAAIGDLETYLDLVPEGPLAQEVRSVLERLGASG